MRLGYCIYTFDGVADARVHMDIVRDRWEPVFGPIHMVHAFNGELAWWPEEYREDKVLRLENPGHFEGAANLMDAGVAYLQEQDVDYIVVAAADTWVLAVEKIHAYLERMQAEGRTVLSCPWGTPLRNDTRDVGLATDFFVIDAAWQRAYRVFPLQYKDFCDRYLELVRYTGHTNVMVERLFRSHILTACHREQMPKNNKLRAAFESHYLELSERIPVHATEDHQRRHAFPELEMETSHDQEIKRRFCLEKGLTWHGAE